MQNQLDEIEQQLYSDLGPRGLERLARLLFEDRHYDTEQRARGFVSKAFNPGSNNGLRVKHLKAVIRACHGEASWLRDLLVYQAQVQQEFANRQMRTVRPSDANRRTG